MLQIKAKHLQRKFGGNFTEAKADDLHDDFVVCSSSICICARERKKERSQRYAPVNDFSSGNNDL